MRAYDAEYFNVQIGSLPLTNSIGAEACNLASRTSHRRFSDGRTEVMSGPKPKVTGLTVHFTVPFYSQIVLNEL